MPDLVEEEDIYPLLISLQATVAAELTASGAPVEFSSIHPGLSPIIERTGNGKTCSELILNMTNAYPVSSFPTPDDSGTCATEMSYEVQVGVFRCAPTVKKNGIAPSAAEILESTRLHLSDMATMRRAICKELKGKRHYILRNFTPYGPEGMVVGGVWLILVGPSTEES